MKPTIIQLLKVGKIVASLESVSLHIEPGVDLDIINKIQSVVEFCYVGDDEVKFPLKGIASKAVDIGLNRSKLRSKNIIIRDTLDSYISMDLRTNKYRGFASTDYITVILDQKFYSFEDKPVPSSVRNVENCCQLFDTIWNMADFNSESTAFFLLEEPIEIPGFSFDQSLIHPLKTAYSVFSDYFLEANGEKRACFKGQLKKFLQHIIPSDRLRTLMLRLDEIFQNTCLAYDRYCLRYEGDRLAALLEKESLDIIERVKNIGESLKAELIVLATNAFAFSSIELDNSLTGRTLLVGISIVLINIVFQIVLCNGYKALTNLYEIVSNRKELLLEDNPEQQHSEINHEFDRLNKTITTSKIQFVIASVVLWLPLITGLLIFWLWPVTPT